MSDLISFLTDPFQLGFMQRALIALILIGLTSGVMGAYVVTRGLSFLGDALAHSVLPGVAIAYSTMGNQPTALLLGGVTAGIVSAVSIGLLTRGRQLTDDTAIGIVFAATMALGIALLSQSGNFAVDLQHILIGNIVAVQASDLWLMVAIGGFVLLVVLLLYKEFLLTSFDQTLAQTLRLPYDSLRILLLVLLALTIVIGVQAIGIVLVVATLVTPAATARFYTRRLQQMMGLSALIAITSGVVGLYIAWYQDIEVSAAIVLTMTAIFGITYLLSMTPILRQT